MNNKIYELTETIDKNYNTNNVKEEHKHELVKEIKKCLIPNSLVLAQCNPISCDMTHNAKKAQQWINWANLLEIDAIIFPELFLVGSPLGDNIKKFPIIAKECREWLNCLAKLSRATKIIIGFIEENEPQKEYYNSVAILQNGKIEKIIRKNVLQDYKEAHEKRIFAKPITTEDNIVRIGDYKACIIIGDEPFDKDTPADYYINCTASISRTDKECEINNKLSNIAKTSSKPIVYVNQVGASDCFSYDGNSKIFDSDGKLTYNAKSFEEQFFIVNPFDSDGKIYNQIKNEQLKKQFSLNYEYDLERTYQTLIQAIKDYFKKFGFKRACLGLSGGLDSTVCAVLLTDAIGKENVFGISMPSKITSNTSKNDAKQLAQNLGINFLQVPIKNIFDTTRTTFDELFSEMESKWNFRYKESYTNDNIQARARATILWGISNEFEKCLPIATSDKSESYMGYATINGDMSGGFAPIADVTKTKLFALAKWMNENRTEKNSIPQSIIEKRPGAELAINPKTGKPLLAEEALMPYEFLDEVIWRIENLSQDTREMLNEEFLYEKNNKISKEQKLEWLKKFFKRMSGAKFKWTLMPPAPIVDTYSINKAEYSEPIMSALNYEKTDIEEKLKILQNQ